MPFCFIKFRPDPEGDGVEVDCPKDVEYLLLADPPQTDWGLFLYASDSWKPETPAGEPLSAIIESGKRYPPALALARSETEEVFEAHQPSIDEFSRAYITSVKHHLSRQHDARYVLAMALRDEDDVLAKGEWYWIIGHGGSVVSWISDDFCVYENSVADFDLTSTQLKLLG